MGSQLTLGFLEAARGYCRRTQTHATGHERRLRIVGDGIFVDRDMSLAQGLLSILAGNVFATQIHQHYMTLGTPRDNAQTTRSQTLGQGIGVLDDLLGVILEARLKSLLEGSGLGCYDMHQWSPLNPRENGRVDGPLVRGLDHDDTTTRSAPGFMCGR